MSTAVEKDAGSLTAILGGTVWRHGFYAAAAWLLAAVVTGAFPDVVPWGSRNVFIALLVAGAVILAGLALPRGRYGLVVW